MTLAREKTVNVREEGVYHCICRCVREAFLCGYDRITNRNYNHRKKWVVFRLKELVEIFCIDLLAFAVMSTHNHTLLRNRPDKALALTPVEIAERWLRLFPRRRDARGRPEKPTREEVLALTNNTSRIEVLRWRLCDISWFMRCLNENIARRANKEDDVTGRFWSGRFKCIRIDDDPAVITCMAYIDLNQVRASTAKTPETSEFTSIYQRISGLRKAKDSAWLCPIADVSRKQPKFISLEEYLTLVDLTGKTIVVGKTGHISKQLAPILERLAINENFWISKKFSFEECFSLIAGTVDAMTNAAMLLNRKWLKGKRLAAKLFITA